MMPSYRIKLWKVLLSAAVIGIGLGLFPKRIGFPILFVIECILVLALLSLVFAAALRRLAKR